MNQCIDIVQKQNISPSQWVREIADILLTEAHGIADEDIAVCAKLGEFGGSVIEKGDGVMHHCNTGSLATVCGGTALGAITKAFYDGKRNKVFVNETRPRLQGSRLTSWELSRMGIEHKVVVDGCVAHLLSDKKIDCIIVGCDRVAANGDTANKIGTHTVATVAHQYGVPFYISCPVSTIDLECAEGKDIVIEERNINEIKQIGGVDVANPDADCYNPAFDVTPYQFITAFITEYGICYPPFKKTLKSVVQKQKDEVRSKTQQKLMEYAAKMKRNRNGRAKL